MDALRTVILKAVGSHAPAVQPVKITDVAIFGRDSVVTTAPKMVNGKPKLSLGIPSSEAGVSRSQCTLTVHQGSSLGLISDAMTPVSPTAGKSSGSCAVIQVDAGAKNAVLIRRGPSYRLLNPGKQCALHDQDVIEFDTWRPRVDRKFTYLVSFLVPARDQAAMQASSSSLSSTSSSSASSFSSSSSPARSGKPAQSPKQRQSTPTKTPTKGTAKISAFFSSTSSSSSSKPTPNWSASASTKEVEKTAPIQRVFGGNDDDDVVVVVDSPVRPAPKKLQQPETIVIDSPQNKSKKTAASTAPMSKTGESPPFKFAMGSIVTVQARLGPGQNKPGGVARILKVTPVGAAIGSPSSADANNATKLYDVKYILGGSERNLPPSLLSDAPSDVSCTGNDDGDSSRLVVGQENNGASSSSSSGGSSGVGGSPNDKITPIKGRLSRSSRKGTSPLTQHKDIQHTPSPSQSSSSVVVEDSPNDTSATSGSLGKRKSTAGSSTKPNNNTSSTNTSSTIDGYQIGLGDAVEVRVVMSDKRDGIDGDIVCWSTDKSADSSSSSNSSQGRWARATVVATPAVAAAPAAAKGDVSKKWVVALHGVWADELDDVSKDASPHAAKTSQGRSRDDDDDDDDDESPREAVPARMCTVEVPEPQAAVCLRCPKQQQQQQQETQGDLTTNASLAPLAQSFATIVLGHAVKRRRLGCKTPAAVRGAVTTSSVAVSASATAGPIAAAPVTTPATKKRRKLPTPLTNALLKDLDGGHFPDLAATVRDAGGHNWRATTRFTTDGLKAMYPCSEDAERKHAQLRKTTQRVIAADIVLSRLTAHQMPPLNNNRGSSSSGSVDAMPSSSTTCASQDPPPGGVQSLTELEAALKGLLEAAPLSPSSSYPSLSSSTGTTSSTLSSVAKLAALISCGQLAFSSLAACWGRDALWHLLARSTVRDRPAAEGLVGLATEVLSKYGAHSCHTRMSGDAFAADACTVAAQCLGLLAAVRGPDALRDPLRNAQAHRQVPNWAGGLMADALATFHAQFNAQEQAASSPAAVLATASGGNIHNGSGNGNSGSNTNEMGLKWKAASSATPLPSGCCKPPSLNVANALQLAH